jgi:hypothetical protein
MVGDTAVRRRTGEEGRAFVESHHSRQAFLAAFSRLIRDAGVAVPEGLQQLETVTSP